MKGGDQAPGTGDQCLVGPTPLGLESADAGNDHEEHQEHKEKIGSMASARGADISVDHWP